MPGKWIICICLSMSSFLMATEQGTIVMNPPFVEVEKVFPGIEILRPGSILNDVSLPKFEYNKLKLLVTSPLMKVESRVELSGDNVKAYLFDELGKQTSTVYMRLASYFFNTSILISKEKTILKDDRADIVGTKAFFDTDKERVLILGPVKTVLRMKKLTKEDKEQ